MAKANVVVYLVLEFLELGDELGFSYYVFAGSVFLGFHRREGVAEEVAGDFDFFLCNDEGAVQSETTEEKAVFEEDVVARSLEGFVADEREVILGEDKETEVEETCRVKEGLQETFVGFEDVFVPDDAVVICAEVLFDVLRGVEAFGGGAYEDARFHFDSNAWRISQTSSFRRRSAVMFSGLSLKINSLPSTDLMDLSCASLSRSRYILSQR